MHLCTVSAYVLAHISALDSILHSHIFFSEFPWEICNFLPWKKKCKADNKKKSFLCVTLPVFLNLKDPIQVLGQVSTLFYFLTLPCSDLAPWCPSLQLFPFRCGSGGLVAGFWCPCKLSQQFTLLELVLSISMPFLAALLIISHEIFATFSKYNSWI